jgi:shikimate dehydrogenase
MAAKLYGLIGKNIAYSFSKKYFSDKFSSEPFLDCKYENFDIEDMEQLKTIVAQNPNLRGLNVTIPFKQAVMPYLNKVSKKAKAIGAVNVIKLTKKGNLKGYNSDCYGFKKSLKPLLENHHKKALILGTGGAAQAIAFALKELQIQYTFASRNPMENAIGYDRINATSFDNYQIVINCSPIGTSPNVEAFPEIPYQFFTKKHLAFDLIYNPAETTFLKKARENGAVTKNGYDMLKFQADKSWEIWAK